MSLLSYHIIFERAKTILVSISLFSKVHLMEVNARPELKDDIIDKTVNRPMVCFFTYYVYKYVAIVYIVSLI